MPNKLLFALFFFICFSKQAVLGQKSFLDAPHEVDKMNEAALAAIKLIEDNVANGAQLRAAANNIQLHFQDSIHVFYKSIGALQDQELQKAFSAFIKTAQRAVYRIGTVVNVADPARTRSTLKQSLNDLIGVLPVAKALLPKLSERRLEFALNVARRAYDCSLFGYYVVYVQVKYRNENNARIVEEIKATVDGINGVLDKLGDQYQQSGDLAGTCRLLVQYVDESIFNLQRFVYTHVEGDPQTKTTINNASRELTSIAAKLRKQLGIDALKEFFTNLSVEVKKLSEITEDDAVVTCKDVLLEILANLLTIKAKLEFFFEEKI